MTTKSDAATGKATVREPKRALGRGLSALIPDVVRPTERTQEIAQMESTDGLRNIPLLKIALNPYQPRKEFSPEQLEELADSIRQHGVLQPIVVRPKGKSTFELVAGERRFRAATNVGLSDIPAIVRDIDDRSSLAIALIENIQRQELNALDSARAYKRLMSEFHLTQAELAAEVGKSQPTIANSVRLLLLPEPILVSLSRGEITEGHAKALLSLEVDDDKIALWKSVVKGALSVRETERRASAIKGAIPRGITRTATAKSVVGDFENARVEENLSLALGTKVKLRFTGPDNGQIEIQFYELDQLEGLLLRLTGKALGSTGDI
jgi:ParB family chromosome partitioning protein